MQSAVPGSGALGPEAGLRMADMERRLSQTPGVLRRPAPPLGEHTDAILAEAGLDLEAIARLRREGAAA